MRDRPALRAWIRTLLIDAVPAQIEPVRATLRRWRPDVVATDPMLYQVALASHHEGLRWLGVSSSLNPVVPPTMDAELVRTLADLAPARGRLFADHGLPDVAFAVADHLSPWGTTVFATAAYAGVFGPSPPGVSLVGPSTPAGPRGDEPAFPWQILPERPLIYASFGSQVAWQPERFDRLALATASLGVTLVLSLGNLAGTPWARALPEHVVGVPYAPQRALLERAAAFVTHGGANSVMEALTAGTPLLISPICNDQPLQARFVRAAGVGLECDLDVASVDEVRGGLASLLAGEGAPRLPEVAASYRAHDGAAAVARLALALAE